MEAIFDPGRVMDEGYEDQSRAAKQTQPTSQTPSHYKNNRRNDSNHHKLRNDIHTHYLWSSAEWTGPD